METSNNIFSGVENEIKEVLKKYKGFEMKLRLAEETLEPDDVVNDYNIRKVYYDPYEQVTTIDFTYTVPFLFDIHDPATSGSRCLRAYMKVEKDGVSVTQACHEVADSVILFGEKLRKDFFTHCVAEQGVDRHGRKLPFASNQRYVVKGEEVMNSEAIIIDSLNRAQSVELDVNIDIKDCMDIFGRPEMIYTEPLRKQKKFVVNISGTEFYVTNMQYDASYPDLIEATSISDSGRVYIPGFSSSFGTMKLHLSKVASC